MSSDIAWSFFRNIAIIGWDMTFIRLLLLWCTFFAAAMAHVVWHTYLSRKDGMHSDGWICYHVLHHLYSVPWSILIRPGRWKRDEHKGRDIEKDRQKEKKRKEANKMWDSGLWHHFTIKNLSQTVLAHLEITALVLGQIFLSKHLHIEWDPNVWDH